MALLVNRPVLAKSYKVAAWDGSNFGTPVETLTLQQATITPQHATDQKKVGGVMEHLLSVPEGGSITLGMVGLDVAVLEIITNMTHSITGSAPSQKRTLTLPHTPYPYFGLIVQYEIDGGGDLHAGFPRCKLNAYPTIEVSETSAFSTASLELMFGRLRLSGGTLINAMHSEFNETAQDITADFDTFFGIS